MARQSINYSVSSVWRTLPSSYLTYISLLLQRPATSKLPPLISTAGGFSQMACISSQLVTLSLARRWKQWHHLQRKVEAFIMSRWRLSQEHALLTPACGELHPLGAKEKRGQIWNPEAGMLFTTHVPHSPWPRPAQRQEVLRGCASAIPYCFSTIINSNAVIKIENIQEREIEKVNPEARA